MMEVTEFYDKKVTCLFCDHSFQTKQIRSRFIRVKSVHSDFYTEYKGDEINPYFYEVVVCPECGFSSTDSFSKEFPFHTREAIKKQLINWKKQDFGKPRSVTDAIKTKKLAILSAVLKKEKDLIIAGLCLRLAWLYRLTNSEEQELRFLANSLTHYKAAYINSEYIGTSMTELTLLYLMGELARRIGEIEESASYFSKVIQHKQRHLEPKIVEMTREQWYLIRNRDQKVI
ncbi:DUF2225 domain-containing protein [Alkalihalobacillus sp. MEB130]|uniref:DUF2225 domain-containing protein n=1 Tax=Alkalihalobacillus sp. MEB130 TaxID=2976704 RepID=UPI0028DDFABF|nr:DUF2225 domain-containing protein [Alkalihalobacillus sp. MEB130]MDT8862066.1 DUF2225 domain-containing protein [Alkalihalobacillus sp. MEB130]